MATVPNTFGSQAGPIPLSELDTNFASLAQGAIVFCTATGGNAIQLQSAAGAPTVSAYANYQLFLFPAPATSTGGVTIAYGVLAALPAYLPDGVTQFGEGNGNLISSDLCLFAYNSALDSGGGGFVLVSTLPISTALDYFSMGQGAVLYRGSSNWVALAPGVSGQVLTTGGASANPSWQSGAFSKSFTSSLQAIPSSGTQIQVAHSLGSAPFDWDIFIQCQTSDSGYLAGNTLKLSSSIYSSSTGTSVAFQVWADATNIYALLNNSSGVISVANGTNSGTAGMAVLITNTNWKIILKAWL